MLRFGKQRSAAQNLQIARTLVEVRHDQQAFPLVGHNRFTFTCQQQRQRAICFGVSTHRCEPTVCLCASSLKLSFVQQQKGKKKRAEKLTCKRIPFSLWCLKYIKFKYNSWASSRLSFSFASPTNATSRMPGFKYCNTAVVVIQDSTLSLSIDCHIVELIFVYVCWVEELFLILLCPKRWWLFFTKLKQTNLRRKKQN